MKQETPTSTSRIVHTDKKYERKESLVQRTRQKINMTKKKIATLSAALGLSCVALIGGMSAYFTDAETATNEFTVGRVSLDLQEPNWEPPTDITPNQTIEKDPQVQNDGINDEFIFLEVKVPYKNIITANPDGTRKAAADTELFSYTVNSGWTEIGTGVKNAGEGVVTHLYVYGTAEACTPLQKGSTTPTLFDTVTFCNAIEDQGLEETSQEIVINAYGIQTTDIANGDEQADTTKPTEVWEVINNQKPSLDAADNIG